MIDVVIERSRWNNYSAPRDFTYLKWPEDGSMCCMGFMCLAAGVPEDRLLNVERPDYLDIVPAPFKGQSSIIHELIGLNDEECSAVRDSEVREQRITNAAVALGFQVTFEGELS